MNYSKHEAIRYQYLADEAAAFARFYREQMKHSLWRYGEYGTAATVKRDECAAGEAEPVNGILGEERNRCTRFLVERRTDHDELAFGPALHFAPAIRSATTVMAIPAL